MILLIFADFAMESQRLWNGNGRKEMQGFQSQAIPCMTLRARKINNLFFPETA
jgi:hypothetical protein